jgi:glycosidase
MSLPTSRRPSSRRRLALPAIAAYLMSLVPVSGAPLGTATVLASHTPDPATVTIAGSLQSELGCPADWQPDCATTHLAYDADDGVWQGTWALPAGSFEYKAALNDGWAESYGLHTGPDNVPLSLGSAGDVKFYYDHKSHWVTDNKTSLIAVAPGSFQSELGCAADWDAGCLRSWLQDPDGDGIYRFVTTALPAGTYETKVAIGESWAENYGQGGVREGLNISFTVPASGSKVTFTYNPGSHVLSILAGHTANNDVEWDGLRHDSRDPLYRTPGGAVAEGTNVTLRFRTFHADVTGVKVRVYSVDRNGQRILPMTRAAADVGCYQPGLETETCDFWSVTLPDDIVANPDVLWYRFIVSDGTDTDYYADDSAALDGGLGAPSDAAIDRSWALSVTASGFAAPAWAKNAVVYQIFPDRFRNGRKDNDPRTGDLRYDDPVLKLDWGTLPEGFCRNYADAATNCPWRFDATPPDWSPTKEGPRGRDYMGGDLRGVDQELDYLASLGVTAIYFNPIFDAGSNHSYDTQDYTVVDPYFGSQKDFDNLVKHAKALGIRLILDGVFNHLSSDSPFFDRYHHYPGNDGACESAGSAYRAWFTFHDVLAGQGTCVSSTGVADGATYDGWFGFDSIPVLTKSNPQVSEYFLTGNDAIAKLWLRRGAGAWRMDVSGDPSFPADYWPTFRSVVKATKADALTISETWQKDSTLLRMILGDRLDTTMNYRLRDAVIAFLAPGPFDSKGFADSGHAIAPSAFAERMASQREDYADAAYYSLMNLLDSHDTERLLWTLTPGTENRAGRELDADNVAAGKRAIRLASVIQFTVPGMPTVYYGDEAGVTGDDDPDDRRTYPWADLGGSPDASLLAHYRALGELRHDVGALTGGDFRVLLADDATGVVAYGRRTGTQAAIVVVNRGSTVASVGVPLEGYVPNGIAFTTRFTVGSGGSTAATTSGGQVALSVPARGALVLATGTVDLTPPPAPGGLHVTAESANGLDVAWNAVSGAAGYDVYVSPLPGGGYVKANDAPVTSLSFSIDGLPNAQPAYVVVRARDAAGNISAPSNETSGLPHVTIGRSNLQWPPTLTHTISAVNRTDTVYGQVWIDGVTSLPGLTPSLRAQLGFGPDGSDPSVNPDAWSWVEAAFNVDAGNNDEFEASLLPDTIGQFDYAYRYSTTGGRDWVYGDLDGSDNGYSPAQAGSLTVNSSGDLTAPTVPTGLHVVSASPSDIVVGWDAIAGDPTLYGYEILRSDASGGPYALIGSTTDPTFTDASVSEGETYWYVVRSVDLSFNRSAGSAEVSATASPRTVTVVFTAEVPATTDATGRTVNIAGTLSRLDGGLPDWNPGATHLTRLDATHWRVQLTGREGTQLEYKYVLDDGNADWTYVEKDGGCGEIANRLLTLSYGTTGTQAVNDVVQNWRNVAPCGN